MLGWKIVIPFPDDSFCSAFSPLNPYVRWYRVGSPTLSPLAPMFFTGDEADAGDLLWALRSNGVMAAPIALLRVEAIEPTMEIARVAQEQADYAAYWQAVRDGASWPVERSYGAHPYTRAAERLTPLMIAWRGLQISVGEDEAARLAEIQRGMDAARGLEPEPVKPSLYLPVARAR